jgi:hypothetical protein
MALVTRKLVAVLHMRRTNNDERAGIWRRVWRERNRDDASTNGWPAEMMPAPAAAGIKRVNPARSP